ncbi:MAG: hypothetical protein ACOYOO_03580 [Saprospiraceae bacterium]
MRIALFFALLSICGIPVPGEGFCPLPCKAPAGEARMPGYPLVPQTTFPYFPIPTISPAQTADTFPPDPLPFIAALESFILAAKNEAATDAFKAAEPMLREVGKNAGAFGLIYHTCSLMRARRLSASPYFKRYLEVLPTLRNLQADTATFRQWHLVLEQLLQPGQSNRIGDFGNFLNFSEALFTLQSFTLASGASLQWRLEVPTWKLGLLEGSPVLQVEQTSLLAWRLKDSMRISATSGDYFPLQNLWKGKSGKVTWERAGLGPDVFVELDTYSIDIRRGTYSTGNALLTYPQLLGARKTRGTFTDRISPEAGESTGSYPKFEADGEFVEIKNLGDGIQFGGSFRLEGKTFTGIPAKDRKAQVNIYTPARVLVFRGEGDRFSIRKGEVLSAERVRAVFYADGDSITHPSANIQFSIPDGRLRMYRGETGNARNPFFSAFHQVNIFAEDIIAGLNGDSVIIGKPSISIARKEPVRIESLDFFNKAEYTRLQGIASFNPIGMIKATSEREGSRILDPDKLAKGINPAYSAQNISGLLFDLAEEGFVSYDNASRQVEIKDKVFHYVNAHNGKTDFDILRIISNTDSVNAVLYPRSKNISLRGLNIVPLSPWQQVSFLPDSGRAILGANRSLRFDGKIQAGFSEIQGSKFRFDYPDFTIRMDSIKTLRLFAPETRPSETPDLQPFELASTIERFSGKLYIDAADNKGNLKKIPVYPALQSTTKSYVFYDGPFAKDTVYKRDAFFFELDTFRLDQLDDYIKTEIALKGRLVSDGIFPDFRESLRVRPDYSLGFEHRLPDTGYPVFQKKGVFTGTLDLSNRGLFGKGTLKYLGAALDSEDFQFRPGQALGSAREFALQEVRGSTPVPNITGKSVRIDWRPGADSMYISSADAAFRLFKEGVHTLNGRIILTPGGLKGIGTLEWPQARITSPQFAFGAFSASADTMELEIKSEGSGDAAIKTGNIRGTVNFDEKKGVFRSNQEFLKTTLPYNRYETSMNEFDWDMAAQNIIFKSDKTKPGTFTATQPDRDTLAFQGTTASYSLKDYSLRIGGIPYIKSADAFIYPDSGRVDIRAGGEMTVLENATIICDTLTRNHRISRATVTILGRKEYRAKGFYEYPIGDKKQEIAFGEISGTRVGKGAMSQKATATLANGTIEKSDLFLIDPKTAFYGNISLGSESANLKFDGFARLESEALPERNWFNISSEGDKKQLAIRIKNPKSEEGFPLANGLFLSKEVANIYPRVMMPLFFRKDRPIFPTEGVFLYDKKRDAFLFGDSARVTGNALRGNLLTFFSSTGKVEAEGAFNLCSGLRYYSVKAAGKAKTEFQNLPDSLLADTPPPAVDFDLFAGLTFPIPEKLIRLIQNEIAAASFGTNPIPYLADLDYYRKGLTNLFPESREFQDALTTMGNGIVELPKATNTFTFLFSNLKMRWDRDYQSLVTVQPEAGLISMLGQPVNLKVTCYVEFKMTSNEDDRAYFYLKLPNEIYYYVGYRNGILELNANDSRFMGEASKMKAAELLLKMPDGENYEIQLVEANRATAFVRRAQAVGK